MTLMLFISQTIYGVSRMLVTIPLEALRGA